MHHGTDHEASRGLEGLGSGAQDPDSSLLLEIFKLSSEASGPMNLNPVAAWPLGGFARPAPPPGIRSCEPQVSGSERGNVCESWCCSVGHQTRGGARRTGCGQREQKKLGDGRGGDPGWATL